MLKRCVLRLHLKLARVFVDLMDSGRLFQTVGPAKKRLSLQTWFMSVKQSSLTSAVGWKQQHFGTGASVSLAEVASSCMKNKFNSSLATSSIHWWPKAFLKTGLTCIPVCQLSSLSSCWVIVMTQHARWTKHVEFLKAIKNPKKNNQQPSLFSSLVSSMSDESLSWWSRPAVSWSFMSLNGDRNEFDTDPLTSSPLATDPVSQMEESASATETSNSSWNNPANMYEDHMQLRSHTTGRQYRQQTTSDFGQSHTMSKLAPWTKL